MINVNFWYYFGKPTPAFRTHLNVLSTDMKVLGFWSPWGLGYGRPKFKIVFASFFSSCRQALGLWPL